MALFRFLIDKFDHFHHRMREFQLFSPPEAKMLFSPSVAKILVGGPL
jgi:hypothetical protein